MTLSESERVMCANPNCVDGKLTAGCAIDEPLLEADCPDCLRRRLLDRLHALNEQQYQDALATLRSLANPVSRDTVSDGQLIDAAFVFASRCDLANPVVPIMSYVLERLMYLGGIPETPNGLKREWKLERT